VAGTIIGQGITIEGEITSDEEVVVDWPSMAP
jgi:cytoskeletal protein CcmA (bactofilin family)